MVISLVVASTVALILLIALFYYRRHLRIVRSLEESLRDTLRDQLEAHLALEHLATSFEAQCIGAKLLVLQRVVNRFTSLRFLNDFESEEVLFAMTDVADALCSAVRGPEGPGLTTEEVAQLRTFLSRSEALAEIAPFTGFDAEMWQRWDYVTRGPLHRITNRNRDGHPIGQAIGQPWRVVQDEQATT